MKQSNIFKCFLLMIMVAFLVKCIWLSIDFSNISIDLVYLEPNYWLSKYKSSKYRPSGYKLSTQKILANKVAHSNQFQEKSSCRSLFEIHKSSDQNWDKDEPYEALSESLPPLLIWPQMGKTDGVTTKSTRNVQNSLEYNKTKQNNSEDAVPLTDTVNKPILLDETRLQILNGSVPYLPCKIKYYTATDVETCVSARAAVGSSTWIAFVGASKMREKLHEFLNLLPESFTYVCFVAEEQVSIGQFLDSIAHKIHGDYDVIGYTNNTFNKNETHKIRITVLWEPFGTGSKNDIKPPEHPSTRLFKMATDAIIPDVVVIGLGTWYLLDPAEEREYVHKDPLSPFDHLDFNIRKKLKDTLQQITKKTKVLLWAHGRFRQYHLLAEPRPPSYVKENQLNQWFFSRLYLHTLTYSIGYMDSWLSNIILKDSDVWRWDSTLPFHYANIRECSAWRPSAIINYPDGSQKSDTRYTGTWWHCQDTHHSSYQTNHDEAQMLLNMLCNPVSENVSDELCC